jgi:hypothetical protein
MVFHVTEDGQAVEHYEVTPENGTSFTALLTPSHAERWEEMGAEVKKLDDLDMEEPRDDEYKPSEEDDAKPAPKRRGRPPKNAEKKEEPKE